MSQHQDESLIDKVKGMFGMGDGHGEGRDRAGRDAGDDEHAGHHEPGGHPRDMDHHATAPGAGVSDAARARSSIDANEDPAMRRDEYLETGAASGQIAMPGGEEPVVGDEDRDAARRTPG